MKSSSFMINRKKVIRHYDLRIGSALLRSGMKQPNSIQVHHEKKKLYLDLNERLDFCLNQHM